MRPCWAVAAVFDRPLDLEWDGIFFDRAPLSWAARNGSKPGRPPGESWTLHGDLGWSAERAEADPRSVADELLDAFFRATAGVRVTPDTVRARFWPFAAASPPLSCGCLWSEAERIGVCGDWCAASRVEGAFLSGSAVAGRILCAAPRLGTSKGS